MTDAAAAVAVAVALPRAAELTPPLRRFLEDRLSRAEDLHGAAGLVSELEGQCAGLQSSLSDLGRRLSDAIAAYTQISGDVAGRLCEVRAGLADLLSCVSTPTGDRDGGVAKTRGDQVLAEELPALAREVARVETVQAYAETALTLDSLIGDVEDAVSSVVTKLRTPRVANSEAINMSAICNLKQIENILTSVSKSRPNWVHLISAVDHRVDRALAVLRPQAIADHRSLLNSLGWPPPLSSSAIINGNTVGSTEFCNPLFLMDGDLKSKYFDSFLSLCNLQGLQRKRKLRQLDGQNLETALRQPLWVIEELVNPVALASQRHFSKWEDKPEFIFALVFKITRDFVDSMDEVLQPLVDKASLVGYSCREEWISAMMGSLSTYLAREIFPSFIARLQDDSSTTSSQAKISWLYLVDQMISLDRRITPLIFNSGVLISIGEEEYLQRTSSLSVFCDRPDWLEIWAEIELGDVLKKLKPALENENSWKTMIRGTVFMIGLEDYKSTVVAGIVLQCLSNVIDRSRPLQNITLRAKFIRSAGAPILREFIDCLLLKCQEAEGLTALADDRALTKVALSINAARYCESMLTEWSEDVFFLEMETVSFEGSQGGCIFEGEINALQMFWAEWVEKFTTIIKRGFDARCWDYFKNKRQWLEKAEEGLTVSQAFIRALDYLQVKITKLQEDLNELEFVGLWRSVASSVDQLVFSNVFMSSSKFNDGGVERLSGDLGVLFGVFSAWCLRPESFFPRLSEGLKLFKLEERLLKDEMAGGNERWLRDIGIRRLTFTEAEKIARNRVFT